MKKNLSFFKYFLIAALLLLSAAGVFFYHQRSLLQDHDTLVSATPIPTDTPSSPSTSFPAPDSPSGRIYPSFEKLLSMPSFHAHTKASIRLRGKLIKGKRKFVADAFVTGANDRDNLRLDMTTKTTTHNKTEKSHSTYKDGLYTTDNGKEKSSTKRSPEEVLAMVTFISDILQDASSQLEDMKISSDGSDTIYEFTLPGETASYYFSQIIEQASMNTKELKNVTGSVDSLKMTCRVNKKGMLTEQSASASGEVSKSIFTIPVTLTETTSFKTP